MVKVLKNNPVKKQSTSSFVTGENFTEFETNDSELNAIVRDYLDTKEESEIKSMEGF
jgi:hypothetical protein